jgi:tetratricopeptide (TPR) repeat protein
VRGLRINDLNVRAGINYDPFANTQSEIFSFQVGSATVNGDRAEVPVTVGVGLIAPPGQPNPIRVVVVKNGNKWQIADLLYSSPTARSLMDSLRRINSNSDFRNVPWENDENTTSTPSSSIPVKPRDTIAKYPTNQDFNTFDNKFRDNPESLVKLRGNQAEQRRKFQNEWKGRNPNAAKFLGAWYTGDRYFYVFPSTAKGGTCVVTQDANGKLDMKIGTVLNQELRYDGGKGFFWRDRPNIIASRDSGSSSLYPIYATFAMPELPENMIGDMERQKCITSLPFEVDAQYYKERGDQFAKVGSKDSAISNYRKAIDLYRKQNQLAQVRNIEAQIVKLGGTNTTPLPTSIATVYRNTKELGLAQLTGTDKKITTAYDNLVRASQGNYSIPVNTSNIEFLKKTITTLRPADCKQLGFSCSEKQISFSDYLELKQKIAKQKEIFEGALSISDKFNAYGERLNSDISNGGKDTLDQISKSTQKIWDEAQSKAQTRVNLSLRDKISLALDQTKDDLLDFTVSTFKTSTKTVATFVQLDEITKIVGDVSAADTLNRFVGAPNYILSVQNNLKDAGQAFLQADGDKIRESMLKTAQSTIEYINLQDSQVSKSASVIKIYLSAKE